MIINRRFYLLVILFVQNVHSAKILAIFPFPGRSHFIMFEKIAKGLVEKGHEIDVYGHFPLETPIKGYNDYSLVGTLPIVTGTRTVDTVKEWRRFWNILDVMTSLCGTALCEPLFRSEILKELRNSNKKYDLFITEMFGGDCMLGFTHHFKLPTVLVITSPPYTWSADPFGLPDNPAYIPNYHSAFTPKMKFHERLVNTIMTVISKVYHKYYSIEPSTRMAREFFGHNMPHLSTLLKNSSIQILNSHFSINQARPLPPNFVEVGGIHIEEPKPLNEHFSKLLQLEPYQKGVIYFTLGSLVQTESLPDETLKGMSDALGKLPYKVLWKAKKERLPKNVTFSRNIHFEWWMPQSDILRHPNIKLYITHGGIAGLEEAVSCGVPVLGIPLFGDQELNIAQLVHLGTAIRLDLEDISEKNVYEAAYQLLNDPKYQQAAKKLQHNFNDRPMTPLQTAVFWIEYVIRHQGAPELKPVSVDLTWYQYHLLDVILVLASVPCVIMYSIYLLIRTCCRRKISKDQNKTSKTKKSQ